MTDRQLMADIFLLADGAMVFVMAMVLAAFVQGSLAVIAARLAFCQADTMLGVLLCHLVLMYQWNGPCQQIA